MDGIAWASSAMQAAQDRLDVATNNLANSSTAGFRASVAQGSLTPSGVRIDAERTHDGTSAIGEMIDVLAAQRAFEGAEKVVAAIDRSRQHANAAGQLK